jgi:hypothetical protein
MIVKNVLIDNVVYSLKRKNDEYEKALNVRGKFYHSEKEDITVREYLCQLLERLWEDDDSFNSKRPFGYSDWEWRVYEVLMREGVIPGTLSHFDEPEANRYVRKLIRYLMVGEQ